MIYSLWLKCQLVYMHLYPVYVDGIQCGVDSQGTHSILELSEHRVDPMRVRDDDNVVLCAKVNVHCKVAYV
jgi:hypothetical protein